MSIVSAPVTFRLAAGEISELDRLARLTRRTRSAVIAHAVQTYLETERSYLEAVQEGIDAARVGDVVAHDVILRDITERRAGAA